MRKLRKKLGVELLIDDATLRAIGHVSAQWAVLEIEFDMLVGQLLRHPDAKGIAPDEIPQSFDRRAGLLRQCVERLLSDQARLREQLIAIINEACSARGHRDKVIHGQWHLRRKNGNLGTAVTVIKRRPNSRPVFRTCRINKFEDVASTISVMTARLIWWQARNVTVGDATDKETAPRSADEIIDRNLMQAGGFEQHLFREMRDSAGFAY
jgi:hypothetical protein